MDYVVIDLACLESTCERGNISVHSGQIINQLDDLSVEPRALGSCHGLFHKLL